MFLIISTRKTYVFVQIFCFHVIFFQMEIIYSFDLLLSKYQRDTLLPPDISALQSFQKCILRKKYLYLRSISHLLLWPNFEFSEELNFDRKKAVPRNFAIFSPFDVKFAAISQFLKISFLKKKDVFYAKKFCFCTFSRNPTVSLAFEGKFSNSSNS